MKSYIFLDVTPSSSLKVTRRFGGAEFYLSLVSCLGLFCDPEEGGDMFVRNFG
jgi:hypothetical protein